jgi:hypothetical protein
MIRFFKSRRRLADLLAARQARKDAQEALSAAQARGDTRGQHYALKRLRDATHALMRQEVR